MSPAQSDTVYALQERGKEMQLDARLAAIAAFVPHGTAVADIGGDHAYLAATLVMRGIAPRAVVGDLSAGACAAARRTTVTQRLTREIDVRQGDGLSVLAPGEAESIVIAGMGGALIMDILSGAPDILVDVQTLVLQPMNSAARLRRWLYGNGWNITDEALARAGGHLYEIIRAEHGAAAMPDDVLLHIGAKLYEKRDPLLREHIEGKIRKLTRAANGMNTSVAARQSAEYRETVSLLAALRTMLALY